MSTYTETITNLVNYLNACRNEYYNNNNSAISDEQYDDLFDKLKQLEEESGIVLSNSPTQNVGYTVLSDLEKVEHKHPLLSLDKTKVYDDIYKFCADKSVLFMHKLDGLTVQLTYKDGELVRAETRGDGFVGEDITHNARTFLCVPKTIPVNDEIRVTGEAIILKNDFDRINRQLGGVYKNPRNLVSGSVRQLDSKICAARCVRFITWNANELSTDGTMKSGLDKAATMGFTTVYNIIYNSDMKTEINVIFNNMKNRAIEDYIPIDGIVAMYNDIKFGESLGKTQHHFRNGLAFKFYDEGYTTTITNIEYTIGKTGTLTPTAVFDPVDIDGVTVTRASVHNLSILKDLNLCIGDEVEVYRANEVIPQIRKNNTTHSLETQYTETIPIYCPYCGSATYREVTDGTEVLVCSSELGVCSGQLLKLISAFVSKQSMDIDGLSEKTLAKFIDLGYIKKYSDIYTEIEKHKHEICNMDGFGEKSVNSLLASIEKSKNTTLARLLTAVNITNVGKQAAIDLAKFFNDDPNNIVNSYNEEHGFRHYYDKLKSINGFGDVLAGCIVNAFEDEDFYKDFKKLVSILTFNTPSEKQSTKLSGMKFVITGKLFTYKNRDELVSYITNNGGTVQSGVSAETTYLINNDIESNSGKNKKAKELGTKIITEDQFIKMFASDEKQNVENETVEKTNTKTNKKKLF